MNKDIETLKERITALVDECNLPYVISLLNDLENAIHEHSFDDSLIKIKPITSGLENCSIWWG